MLIHTFVQITASNLQQASIGNEVYTVRSRPATRIDMEPTKAPWAHPPAGAIDATPPAGLNSSSHAAAPMSALPTVAGMLGKKARQT